LVLFWTSKKEQAKNKVRQKLTRLVQSADCFVPRNEEIVVLKSATKTTVLQILKLKAYFRKNEGAIFSVARKLFLSLTKLVACRIFQTK
jgi:hypothetical protein